MLWASVIPRELGFENQKDYRNLVSETIIEQHPKYPGFWTQVTPGSQQVLGAQECLPRGFVPRLVKD